MDNESVYCDIQQNLTRVSEAVDSIAKRVIIPKDFLTEKEIGELLGVSDRTLRYYRQRRYIDYIKIGAQVYYPSDAITKMMDAHRIPSNNG